MSRYPNRRVIIFTVTLDETSYGDGAHMVANALKEYAEAHPRGDYPQHEQWQSPTEPVQIAWDVPSQAVHPQF